MRIPLLGRKEPKRGRSVAGDREGWLRPQTKRALTAIILFLVALISLLAFFGAAGPTGAAWLLILRRFFGWLGYVAPLGLLAMGWYLIRPQQEETWPRLQVVGMGLLLVGLLGLFHVIGVSAEDAYQTALDGRGGGLSGFALSWLLVKAFGPIAAGLLFATLFVIGVVLTLNMAPGELWDWVKGFVPGLKQKDEEDETEEVEDEEDDAPVPSFRISRRRLGGVAEKPDPQQLKLQEEQAAREQEQKERVKEQLKAANKAYRPPSLDILHSSIGRPDSGNVNENKKKIETTLEKFGVGVTMKGVSVGPTVAQYTLRPDEGVKLSRITALQNDLALALAAHPIRIEAPIPNTNLVGIEIPNKDVSLVRLKDLLAAKEFRRGGSPLTIAMGKDVAGKPRVAAIDSMPHMLVAGATGSGKSIFINTLILSLLYRNSPALVRLIMVDPKRVELSLFNGIPHLLTPVITEPDKTVNALKWAVKEMDRRYRLLSETGARNLMSYNSNNPDEALPMVVIIIDELADLMATHAREVEGMIVRLAQMARAIGIHLVLATQRPSVNVITGLIKANVPARVAFNVASQVDSRTILDGSGAEKLLGSGDMLFLSSDQAKPVRLQGSFVSEEEVRAVVEDIKKKNPVEIEHDNAITSPVREANSATAEGDADDDMFEAAQEVVVETGKASASFLQRRLKIGYARAARLLDMLEERGVVGPQEGNKPREVLAAAGDYGDEEEDGDSYEDEERW